MPARPEDWGFSTSTGSRGELVIGGIAAEDLAREHGTPLQIVDEDGLERRARDFRKAFEARLPGGVSVHYALKCNDTPAVVALVLAAGLRPEVGTLYEWQLVRRLGAAPADVVVNGPNKGPLLDAAIREGAGLIVLDGLDEIDIAEQRAAALGRSPRVLLRVNPDCVPRGMNTATATGSRRRSVFGLDLASGEVDQAFTRLARGGPLQFAGLHCHVGTGIRSAAEYRRPIERLVACAARARRLGLQVDVLDLGGGFGVPTSREMSTTEFLLYQAFGRLPAAPDPRGFPSPADFADEIATTLAREAARRVLPTPRLVIEPGRAIVSGAGVLLVTVGRVKERRGVGTFVITDGGAGTVAFPLFYELHEVLLCRAPEAARTRRTTLVGPACFSADWIYRNKPMPPLAPGDVLAICDAGAYFTVQESSFGFPRPPIVGVRGGETRVLRRRETFDDMVARDAGWEVARVR